MDKLFASATKESLVLPGEGLDTERKSLASTTSPCTCAICIRKPDITTAPCDRQLDGASERMVLLHPDESYPDVPQSITPASSFHRRLATLPNSESLIDIAVTSSFPIVQVSPPTESSHPGTPGVAHTRASSLRDISLPFAVPPSLAGSSPPTRLFDHPLSTQSNLSLPASFEAFSTPRSTLPVPQILPAPPNLTMTWVPGLPYVRQSEEVPKEVFPCQICLDDEPYDDAVVIQACGHMFGKTCMKEYILSKLDERRFPIPCPCCSIDESGATQGMVTSGIATQCSLADADCERWDELEFISQAVRYECDKCNNSHIVDRHQVVKDKKKKVRCLTPGCEGAWCRQCSTALQPNVKHKCEGKKELRKLMKKEGWKSCPGCNIPVQKSSGCNHIACSAPGCNTHFCYRCETILIRSVFGSQIHAAISDHFRRRLYFWRCSQFHDPNLFVRIITGRWRTT